MLRSGLHSALTCEATCELEGEFPWCLVALIRRCEARSSHPELRDDAVVHYAVRTMRHNESRQERAAVVAVVMLGEPSVVYISGSQVLQMSFILDGILIGM